MAPSRTLTAGPVARFGTAPGGTAPGGMARGGMAPGGMAGTLAASATGAAGAAGRHHPLMRRVPPQPWPSVRRLAPLVTILGLVAVLALGLSSEASSDLGAPGGPATLAGGMAGLAGMYLALVMLLLVSRIPFVERAVGQDGLVRWHRRLGPWPLSLLVAHAILLTIGFAQAAKTGALRELWVFLRAYPDMLTATVGLALMVVAAVASIAAIRRRLRRETWWILHLYMYLALALSFAHVLVLGPTFVGHPLTLAVWSALWAATAGLVLCYRFGLPLARTLRYRLRVVEVRTEAPGIVSVILSGRHLERLPIAGGQFFSWRFLIKGMWWQAHPYSVSALPRPPYLRLTVRALGDHSAAVARLRTGTKVAIEGPYGAVRPDARVHDRVVLVAGGIGITAVRALLEDLPPGSCPIVIVRASSPEELALHSETQALVDRQEGVLHALVGTRRSIGTAHQFLHRFVPDLHERDVFVCGPKGFVDDVVSAARSLGANRQSIHHEIFSW
ncbi:MAG: ferredoxin reductase family protein [Acidimicrobiales bacterium]